MHYYQFNIGDYASHTRHLSLMEDLAYRRLLDEYYLHERPFNECSTTVARQIGMREHEDAVRYVLESFFVLTDEGWANKRADEQISSYADKREKASKAGSASASKRTINVRSTNVQPTINHKPITNNQETNKKHASSYDDRFEEVWAAYPARPGASKKASYKAWLARLKSGVDPDVILSGVKRYAEYCTGKDPEFIKQPNTFFGASEHYLADWSVSGRNSYTEQALSVIEQYNDCLAVLGWPEALATPYAESRAGAIATFLTLGTKERWIESYFRWLGTNLPAIPGCGFDWAIKPETFLRAREGNFKQLETTQ